MWKPQQIEFLINEWSAGECKKATFCSQSYSETFKAHCLYTEQWCDLEHMVTWTSGSRCLRHQCKLCPLGFHTDMSDDYQEESRSQRAGWCGWSVWYDKLDEGAHQGSTCRAYGWNRQGGGLVLCLFWGRLLPNITFLFAICHLSKSYLNLSRYIQSYQLLRAVIAVLHAVIQIWHGSYINYII